MSERFVIGHMDPHASTIFLTKADPSNIEDEEEPLEIGSWLTLYEGDGPPRTAIKCFEPEPKPAKELRTGDVVLDLGTPYRVLEDSDLPDADGKILLNVRDIFADEVVDLPFGAEEDITMVAASTTRCYVVCFFPVSLGLDFPV